MIHGIVGYEQSIEIIFELVDFNPVFNVAPEPLFPVLPAYPDTGCPCRRIRTGGMPVSVKESH